MSNHQISSATASTPSVVPATYPSSGSTTSFDSPNSDWVVQQMAKLMSSKDPGLIYGREDGSSWPDQYIV